MYNLLITPDESLWNGTACEFLRVRSVNEHEYTDEEIARKYKTLNKEAIAALLTLPCIFGYETGIKKNAHLGWLTAIKPRGNVVRLEFEFVEGFPAITPAKLNKFAAELDITSGELSRNHWAVKDVNLPQALVRTKLVKESDLQKLGKGSKLLQLGETKPISELQIRPSIFRVPNSKVEADLVSVMMPFDAKMSKVIESIKAACKDAGLRCQRADDIWTETEVIQDVFSLIYRSRIVICDFSGRNPNVFYEAGIAHTLGKTVIPIVQNQTDIPFDIAHHRYIQYHNNDQGRDELRTALATRLKTIVGS